MRKITIILTALVSLLAIVSCEKDETRAIVLDNPAAPAFTNLTDGSSLVLEKENALAPIVYEWTQSDFGFDASITYTVQIDKQGNDFADANPLGTANNAGTLTIVTNDLNNKLLTMKGDPEDPTPVAVEFRVVATVGTNVEPVSSTVIKQSITTYYIPIIYPVLHVPGSYQGWNPADENTVIASLKSNNKYEGYLWFGIDNAMFKYTEGPNWDNNWGDTGNDGNLEANGSDIPAGAAGYYKLNVDLNAKTHSYLRTDWGLIGSATPGGWDSDQNLTYDETTKVWTITLDLVVGEIKFRANDAWTLNYGDGFKDAAPPVAPNGILDEGGDNIAIATAGNYTITLDLSKPVYRYHVAKN
jgi:starch-binding outer membrane protein SusE/F